MGTSRGERPSAHGRDPGTADPDRGHGDEVIQPIVIAHVSDLHLGAHSLRAADDLVADVALAEPAVTVVTGDLTMRARADQFAQARTLLDQLPRPRLVVLGNHDLPLLDLASRFASPYDRYRFHLEDELDPVLDLPGVRVLGLQSMPRWRWKSGRVSRRQAGLVGDTLGSAPAAAVRVLALHHPPFQRGLARLAGRDRLVRSLVTARVDLVLAGHTHVPSTRPVVLVDTGGERTGVGHTVIEVVAGTTASVRTRGAGRSWSLIRVNADSVTVEERYHGDSGWRTRGTTRHPRSPRQ